MNEKDIWSMVLERLEKEHGFSPLTIDLWFGSMKMEKLTPDDEPKETSFSPDDN